MKNEIDIENPENIKFGLLDLKKLNIRVIDEAKVHFNYKCPYCNNDLHAGNIRENAEIDHFVPVKKGGQDFPWNLLPICFECNRKKKHKMPYEFLPESTYIICKKYLDSVLFKYTNQHEDKLHIASQVDNFIKQHVENKINDKELIENLYQIHGIEIKKQVEPLIEETEDTSPKDKHIHFFWEALKLINKYNKENFYIKDKDNRIIYVKLKECYPVYRDYCNQIGETTMLYLDLLKLFTQNSYNPFIKGKQKGRKYSINKAGLGSCYRFQYEHSFNENTIIIGDKEVEL